MRAQREEQAGDVGAEQHDRDADRHLLEVATGTARPRRSGSAGRRRSTSSKIAGMISATHGEQQHQRLHVGGGAVERLALALEAADEHRGAHDEQDVAEDRADQRRLDDLLQALAQREEGDDQLGRVAERDVEEAADARARSARPAPRSRGPSARRSGSRRAPRRRRSSVALGVRELEHDRDRDERDEQVRPAGPAEQEPAQVEALRGLASRRRAYGAVASSMSLR